MSSPGFLLDIDGCITLADATELHAKADPEALMMLKTLYHHRHPVALITGRSMGWVSENVLDTIDQPIMFPIFMEYGWLWFWKGKLNIMDNTFRDDMNPFFDKLKESASEQGIGYCSEKVSKSPDTGYMWNEDKKVMISIAANTLVPAKKVHEVIKAVLVTLKDIPPYRLVPHHLGIDILPRDSSKKNAALHAREILDKNKLVKKWFIFGDSESDTEMVKAFDPAFENAEFINTREKASLTVKRLLRGYL
ncbi:MAG: hypothetical protein ACTSRU_12765 [Candidatus Hodarchaeales archaeon]